MSSQLPSVLEAEAPLSQRELDVLRTQYESNNGTESNNNNNNNGRQPTQRNQDKSSLAYKHQLQFNYAWGLVRSRERADVTQGVVLLKDIYRTNPARRGECLYYLALAEYKLGNYADFRDYITTLLESDPTNERALHLNSLLNSKVSRDGVIGMAITGTAIAAIGILSAIVFRKR